MIASYVSATLVAGRGLIIGTMTVAGRSTRHIESSGFQIPSQLSLQSGSFLRGDAALHRFAPLTYLACGMARKSHCLSNTASEPSCTLRRESEIPGRDFCCRAKDLRSCIHEPRQLPAVPGCYRECSRCAGRQRACSRIVPNLRQGLDSWSPASLVYLVAHESQIDSIWPSPSRPSF